MTRWTLVAVLGLVLATSPGSVTGQENPGIAAKTDLARLQGTWNLVAMEAEGHAAAPEDFAGRTSHYDGNRLTLKSNGEARRRGIVTLDESRTPKAMNTWDLDGPYEDETLPGIYELDGDNLKLCFARPGEKRPSKFTTSSGTGFLFFVFKRSKP